MPMYTYTCEECGSRLEKLQTHAQMLVDKTQLRCSRCEGRMKHHFGVPAIRTETTFMNGVEDTFVGDERHRGRAMAKARAAGVNPNGKTFFPQLCAPGVVDDPRAWVSDANAQGEIRKRCEDLNYAADGDVTVKQREPATDPFEGRYRVADHIVQERVDAIVEREHGGTVSKKKRADLVEATAERLSGNG